MKGYQKQRSDTSEQNKPGLTRSLLWIIALATGIVVGNSYYTQPVLGSMTKEKTMKSQRKTIKIVFYQ